MIVKLKNMLKAGPVKITFDKHNKNPDGFLYKKNKASLGSLEIIIFSHIQVAGNAANCFVCLCAIDSHKCTRTIPELQLRKGEVNLIGELKHVRQQVRLLTSQWLFHE